MEEFSDNSILKVMHRIFNDYANSETKFLSKLKTLQLFYDYKLIDTCGYNLFHLNSFINQLSPSEEGISIKKFLILIFYVYQTQMSPQSDESRSQSVVSQITPMEVNALVEDRLQIYSTNNIIRLMINKKEQNASPYNFLSPDFTNADVKYILQFNLLTFLANYLKSIEALIFDKYAFEDKKTGFRSVNVFGINQMVFDYPIFKNFNCETIAQYVALFIEDLPTDVWTDYKAIFDERLSNEQVVKAFNKIFLNANEINFSYSGLVVLLAQFALKLKSSQGKGYEEALTFLLEGEFGLKKDNADLIEQIEEEESLQPDYDYVPESESLMKAKKGEYTEGDEFFMNDFLKTLDKLLPEEDANIVGFKNDIPHHSCKIAENKYDVKPAKFPLERLKVEIDEDSAKKLAQWEESRIEKAKKPKKRNNREAPPKPIFRPEIPNKASYDHKYLGNETINTLQYRLLKNSIKDILPNSKVFPSLIREVLLVPPALPTKLKELIVESFRDQVQGQVETSVKRLEHIESIFRDAYKIDDSQTELFFSLRLGSLYDSLNLTLMAFRHFAQAKVINDKLLIVDPDSALLFCLLGASFLKMKEFSWAMRSFQKAKEIREATIGGNTLDTAAIYNNLGVVSYHLESYLPAQHYFKLAYEITKSILGLCNPRTMLIKSNMTKMNQLSFNKTVEFKSLGLYPTPVQMITNPKKKKKK